MVVGSAGGTGGGGDGVSEHGFGVGVAGPGRVCGVAANDAATGELVRVVRGNSRVVWVTATGAIAANAEVQVGANGTATTKAAGVAVGYAVTGAADATDAEISLY